MAYLLLYGPAWTQRWGVPQGAEDLVRAEIMRVGTAGRSTLSLVDPGSDVAATLVIAWAHVAAAAMIEGPGPEPVGHSPGDYA